jgi:hypothetical protein
MNGRDDDETKGLEKHSLWLGIWKQALSFVVGVVIATFFVGGARQKMKDLATWKEAIAPKIERMDSIGSLSFEHWKQAHDKESELYKRAHEREHQAVDERLKELEREVKTIQRERKISQ